MNLHIILSLLLYAAPATSQPQQALAGLVESLQPSKSAKFEVSSSKVATTTGEPQDSTNAARTLRDSFSCDADDDGWILAMRISSSSSTFVFDSPYWTDSNLLRETELNLSSDTDAKFDAFVSTPTRGIRGCYGSCGSKTCIEYSNAFEAELTLQDIFLSDSGIDPQYKLDLKENEWSTMAVVAGMPGTCQSGRRRSGINYDDTSGEGFWFDARGRFGMMCFIDDGGDFFADDFIGFGGQDAGGGKCGAGATLMLGGDNKKWCTFGSIWVQAPESTETDVWQVFFAGIDANFTSASGTELSLKFDIGKNPPSDNSSTGRYKTKLYKQDCATEIATSGPGPLLFNLTDNGRIVKSPANSTFDSIDLLYNVNKTMIASNSVWNSTTKEINICQEVQLIQQSAALGELVIVEDKRVVTIKFDLSANFTLDVDMQEGALTSASGAAGIDDYVSAYKCNERFIADSSPLAPNGELFVCINSSSTDVEIKEIEAMTIKQEGADDLPVIVNSGIVFSAITAETFVSTIKRVVATRVPSNVFSFAANKVIEVDGKAIMQLVGSSSRKLQGDTDIVDTEAVSFGVKVTLQSKASPKDNFAVNSATSLASKGFAALGMMLVFVL